MACDAVPLQFIDHAAWCPRTHPETLDGQSYLVLERVWTAGHYPYLDAVGGAALLHTLRNAAEAEGVDLLQEMTEDGPRIRLCLAWRVREMQAKLAEMLRDMSWDNQS